MIKIKIIPNLLSKRDRVFFNTAYDGSMTIRDYLDKYKIDYQDMKILCSDRGVVSDLDTKINKIKNIDCEIIVTSNVQVPTIISIVSWLMAAYAVVKPYIAFALFAYSIYSATQKPKTPNFNSGNATSGIDEGSPNSGWDGATTINQVGVAIPVVYGEYRVGGNIINRYISKDGDNNFLNMLLGVCEGEIESITDIKIAENPIDNYSAIETYIRLGTNTQDIIPNFEDLHNLYSLGITLLKNAEYEYTTQDNDVEGFDIHFRCPNGLYQVDKQNGNVLAWTVTANIYFRIHGESTWTLAGTKTISALNRTIVRGIFSHRGLTANQYDIKVVRTSDNSSLDPIKAGDLTLYQIDEIQTDDVIYPNLALFAIKALATEQLQGNEPNVTMLVKGTKVSVPYVLYQGVEVDWEDYYYDSTTSQFKRFIDDGVCTWDNETYVTRWSANPVWCLKDLLVNTRYGLGEFISATDLDDTELLEMALYCEERVSDGDEGYEKRYRLDIVIDSNTRAMDAILQLCTAFDAFPVYSGGKLSFKIDKPEDPVQLFTMGNIIKDSFQMSWRADNDAPNVIHAQYNDIDEDGKVNIVSYFDDVVVAQYPAREQTIRIFTSRKTYALRGARRALAVAKYIDRGISFKASIDAIACQAGDVISVAHDVPQWSVGSGRVLSGSSTTKIQLDRNITIESGTYEIQVRLANGTIEERVITDAPGTYSEVNVSVAFSSAPAAFDIYAIGVENILVKDFRVISLQKTDKFEMQIVAMEYNSNIFDDSSITVPDTNYSSLSVDLENVSNLILSEGLIKQNDGTWANSIEVWFNKPEYSVNSGLSMYDHAEIYLSDDSGVSWRKVGESWGENFSITDPLLRIGWTYQVSVRAIGKYSSRPLSASPQGTITLVGGNTIPPDVVNLQIYGQGQDTYFNGRDVKFSWARRSTFGSGDVPAGTDAGLAIRDVSFKDFQVDILVDGVVKRTEFVTDNWYEYTFDKNARDNSNSPVASFTIRVYQRNHYNKLSTNPSTLTVTNPAPKRISGVSWDFGGKDLVISWSPQPVCDLDFRRYKIIVIGDGGAITYYRDSTSFFYGYDENVARNGGFGNRNVTVNIYTEDWFGQLSNVYTIGAVNYAPGVPIVTITPFFNMAMLKWDDVNDTDLKYYEVWQSETNLWAGEEVLADKVAGKMSLVKCDSEDKTLFFKVRGVDNFGAGEFTGPHQAVFIAIDSEDVTRTGTLITLLAQIDSAVIEQLTVANIDAGKITSGYLSSDRIEADSITADKLDVSQLSAIAADLGTIVAGLITGATIRTAASGARSIMDSGGIRSYNSSDTKILDVVASGDDAGDILLGNFAGGNGVKYDSSEGELLVSGDISATSGLFSGVVKVGTAGKVYIDGANEVIKVYDDSNNLRVELGKLA